MISLMMCDDHLSILDTVLGDLSNDTRFTICGKASSGQDCINLINNNSIPDVLILDISMPNGMNGYDVAKYLQKASLPLKIVVFSTFDDLNAIKAMVRFGAKGFVCKSDPIKLLKHAIDQVLEGKFYFTKNMVFSKDEITAMLQSPITWAETITNRDLKMAQLMQNGLAFKEVANCLDITTSAASKKRKKLFTKTETNSTIGLIGFLRKVGLMP